MLPKQMETRVAALESEVASLKTAIHTMQLKAVENQEKLIALLSKNVENVNVDDKGDAGNKV